MIRAGQTITSVETGETFHFLKTAAETDGKLLQIQMTIAPGGGAKAAPIHVHNALEERFYIQSGKMWVHMDGKEMVLGAGESIIVPVNAAHTWREAGGDEPLRFIVEMEPAMQMAEIFETLCAASEQGVLDQDGKAPFLAMAACLNRFPDNFYVAAAPVWAQKLLFKLLSPIAKWMGYEGYGELKDNRSQTQQMPSVA
jgi:mannose-6-phosphate isomerase-like protein (cupin superfamily)